MKKNFFIQYDWIVAWSAKKKCSHSNRKNIFFCCWCFFLSFYWLIFMPYFTSIMIFCCIFRLESFWSAPQEISSEIISSSGARLSKCVITPYLLKLHHSFIETYLLTKLLASAFLCHIFLHLNIPIEEDCLKLSMYWLKRQWRFLLNNLSSIKSLGSSDVEV